MTQADKAPILSLGLAIRVLLTIKSSGIDAANLVALLKRGHLSDLLTCDVDKLDRNAHRRVLGLQALRAKPERNKFGHVVVEVKGSGWSGPAELEDLIRFGYELSPEVEAFLGNGAYHTGQLEPRRYRLVLVPRSVLMQGRAESKMAAMTERFGYQLPCPEMVLRLQELSVVGGLAYSLGMAALVAFHGQKDTGSPVLGIEYADVGSGMLRMFPGSYAEGMPASADCWFVFLDSEQP